MSKDKKPPDTKYRRLLKSRKIQQIDVVNHTGLFKSQVSKFVKGFANSKLSTIKKICVYHGVTPNDIIDFEGWYTEPKKKK